MCTTENQTKPHTRSTMNTDQCEHTRRIVRYKSRYTVIQELGTLHKL